MGSDPPPQARRLRFSFKLGGWPGCKHAGWGVRLLPGHNWIAPHEDHSAYLSFSIIGKEFMEGAEIHHCRDSARRYSRASGAW
jgi:hypothetical protein